MRWVQLALVAALLGLRGGAAPEALAADAPRSAGDDRGDHVAEQVRAAVEEHIETTMRASGGVYPLQDGHAGKLLELEFVRAPLVGAGALWRVHDPDHRLERRAFFACTMFRPVGAPEEKLYDVDMRVEPRGGRMEVTEVRIHKEKRLVGGKWVWEARPARAGWTATEAR